MRKRGFSPEHQEAVARRLAVLSAEWDMARTESSSIPPVSIPPVSIPPVSIPPVSIPPGVTQEWPWEPHTQVRGAVIAIDSVEASAPSSGSESRAEQVSGPPFDSRSEVAELRPPGRHASRRVVPGLLNRAADFGSGLGLRDRLGLQMAHLTWVAVMAVLALAATSWWLVRSKEQSLVTPVSVQTAAASDAVPGGEANGAPVSGPATSTAAAAPGGAGAQGAVAEVVVDVTGKVRRPGIVVLAQGSRVFDALEAAGGARRGVDLQSLNLARVLIDGEQIVVGAATAPAPVDSNPAGAATAPGAPAGALINLNVASLTDLETLPGVGPVTAAAIVEWRTRHGGFTSVDDLLEVSGIGEVTLEQLAPLVTI